MSGFTYTITADEASTKIAVDAYQFRPNEGFALIVKFDQTIDSLISNSRDDAVIIGQIVCICGTNYRFNKSYEYSGVQTMNCPNCGKETHLGTVHGSRAPIGDKALLITVCSNDRRHPNISIDSIPGGVLSDNRSLADMLLDKDQDAIKKKLQRDRKEDALLIQRAREASAQRLAVIDDDIDLINAKASAHKNLIYSRKAIYDIFDTSNSFGFFPLSVFFDRRRRLKVALYNLEEAVKRLNELNDLDVQETDQVAELRVAVRRVMHGHSPY